MREISKNRGGTASGYGSIYCLGVSEAYNRHALEAQINNRFFSELLLSVEMRYFRCYSRGEADGSANPDYSGDC